MDIGETLQREKKKPEKRENSEDQNEKTLDKGRRF